MTIKIPVSADFDPGQIEAQLAQFSQKINDLGQKIAQANKVQFKPVSDTGLDDLKKMTAQFEALKRVSGDLNRRVNATGQKGKQFFDLDWEQMYPDKHSRARQMAKSYQYVTGNKFHTPANPQEEKEERDRRQGKTGGWGQTAAGVAQSGMRAMGPMGGVGANALGSGMSAGFGAGLMGLVGGIAALGVSKLIGAVTEKLDEAEQNAVAYDTLKRTIGDVNVSFDALKMSIKDTASANGTTYRETIKLSTEFAKASNLTSDQYKEAMARGGSLDLGIGMSRSYGLDPSSGVGALGSVRGVGAARDEMQTRRFALLIGETIGKSGAFAKADEVMGAITDYTVAQTRSNLGGVNSSGFGGMFAGLVGSGIAGLDPAGAGNLLSRVNASLSAGGSHGEASQYFTGMVGRGMGLDPLQTQMMREGGAFSTNNTAFGSDSIWARFMGKEGPTGDKTHLAGQLEALRGAYGGNKGMLAQATANHLGVNMSQAMAMHLVDPEQMGELAKFADVTKLSGESLNSLSKSQFGSDSDRVEVANSLYRRVGSDALKTDELRLLDEAFKLEGKEGVELQKKVLAELLVSRGQEDTSGKDIRDSKALLDNLKTSMAEKLIPMTQTMRDGILSIAGVGKDGKTTESLLTGMAQSESEYRHQAIVARHHGRLSAFKDEAKAGGMTSGSPEYQAEIKRLQEEFAAESAREVELLKQKIESIKDNLAVQQEQEKEATELNRQRLATMKEEVQSIKGDRFGASGGGKFGSNVQSFVDKHGPLAEKLAKELGVPAEAILGQWGLETGWGKSVIPGTNNLGNIKDFSGRGPKAKDNMTGSVDSYRAYGSIDDFGSDFSGLLNNKRYASVLGSKDAQSYFSALKQGGYAEDPNYVSKGVAASGMAGRAMGTPMPAGAVSTPGITVGYDPLNVSITLNNDKGQQVAPTEHLVANVKNNYYPSNR